MSRTIMLIPTETGVGLTSVILGLIRAIERKGINLNLFTVAELTHIISDGIDQRTVNTHENFNLSSAKSLKMSYIESLLCSNQEDVLMEEIITSYYANTQGAEVILVEGLAPNRKHQFSLSLNFEIAKALNAEIVFIISQGIELLEKLKKRVELTCSSFGGIKNSNIIGVIFNKLNAPIDEQKHTYPTLSKDFYCSSKTKAAKIDFAKLQRLSLLPVLGAIPWSFDLITARAIDVARHLNATIVNEGDINIRRIKSIIFCSQGVQHMLKHVCSGSLLVTSTTCYDILFAACLVAINGVEISAILLTDGLEIDTRINELYEHAFNTGLPVLMVNTNTLQTLLNLQTFNLKIPADDYERIEIIQEYMSNHINTDWIKHLTKTSGRGRLNLSPPAFLYHLTELARRIGKRILLPEGEEPRTVKAAAICAERGIATCVMLGNPDEINRVAALQNINLHAKKLGANIRIINPEAVRENYVSRLVELRKHKGMTEIIARELLEDNVTLGTLMLEQDEVDGLVSGAVHTTANTIRPPLQLIKTAPGNSFISSIFFMLLPEHVYIYGDCAINLNPTAEQLSEIAILSAESAIAFGIEPRIAMLSYSTGTSGRGNDVEKVREATFIALKKRPDLMIDGPLQYDAAVVTDIAKRKAPNSSVAGRATVFIFPDLNSGNITYKAVQRSVNLISIGPMLQGMRKPVNDLSRGALVSDIIYTIALTAILSSQQK